MSLCSTRCGDISNFTLSSGWPLFLYSIVQACHTQLYPKLNVDVGLILDKINSELTPCPNIYTAFMEGNDIGVMTAFNDYAVHNIPFPY